jgi:hypothetical protein
LNSGKELVRSRISVNLMIGSCSFVSSVLQVPFLNLMANIQQRVGEVLIRVGGNTQDTAVLVPSTPDGLIIEKDLAGVTNPVCYSFPFQHETISYSVP